MISIVSTVASSDVFLMMILPVSTSTASEKLRIILLSTATAVELSVGEELSKVGAPISAVVKAVSYKHLRAHETREDIG